LKNKGDEVDSNFKSKFLADAEIAKEKLDTVSPTMCLAKWKQVSLHLPTGLTNSCYHPPLHKIDPAIIEFNPSALHNTMQKAVARKQMIDGTRPGECNYCWDMEDSGNLSDRHYRSGEPWAIKDFDAVIAAPTSDTVTPSYVEVNFNNACNLACSYCSPQFSSSWMGEVNKNGPYPTTVPHNDPKYFSGERKPILAGEVNPYVDAFWKWWPDLYKDLIHFRMTGGEPLMDKNTYKVFDYVLANPKSDLHLNVTSNFSVDQKLWDKYLDYVKQLTTGQIEHFMQYVSVDTWGEQAEYLRHGLDFNLLLERVEQYLTEAPDYCSITFIITMNNLSIHNLRQLLMAIHNLRVKHSKTFQRVWFDTPVLRTPSWQSMQILPKHFVSVLYDAKEYMEDYRETEKNRYHGFKDYEIQRMQRDIDWMSESTPLVVQKKADFYRFFKEADRRHGTDFVSVFPELAAWWRECEYIANR
jgi:MoaA/NifB/PqqE/SkfB family radical SAM enzyme